MRVDILSIAQQGGQSRDGREEAFLFARFVWLCGASLCKLASGLGNILLENLHPCIQYSSAVRPADNFPYILVFDFYFGSCNCYLCIRYLTFSCDFVLEQIKDVKLKFDILLIRLSFTGSDVSVYDLQLKGKRRCQEG